VIFNDAAWSIIQAQRGLSAVWVFPHRGRPIGTMNNNGWQRARREAGLNQVRVHDLRHTFACRLRAAACPWRIVPRYSDTPIARLQATTPVLTSGG